WFNDSAAHCARLDHLSLAVPQDKGYKAAVQRVAKFPIRHLSTEWLRTTDARNSFTTDAILAVAAYIGRGSRRDPRRCASRVLGRTSFSHRWTELSRQDVAYAG